MLKPEFDVRTLNFLNRKQELEKINNENSTILLKLHSVQPKILNRLQLKEHKKDYLQMRDMI